MSDTSSECSEPEVRWHDLKNNIFRRISEVQSTGSVFICGHFDEYPLPAISADAIGTIAVPLSTRDAQSLIKASRKAPFGKGDKTLVNESVRKTWEIAGSKVSFQNKT